MTHSRSVLRGCALFSGLVAIFACDSIDTTTGGSSPLRTEIVATAGDPVIVAAGDIACGSGTPAGTPCKQAQTAALIGSIGPDAVLPLGDIQYEAGSLSDFNAFYAPTWGAYKSITWPAPGNHEYGVAGAAGYFDYFNGTGVQTGRAGTRGKGYYSYDLGAWHLVVLNSNCGLVGGCGAGSAQEQWLRADLAAHPTACTLAYWHHPRFSSGPHGSDPVTQALWQALVDFDAELVLTGHDHDYERFAPQTATGALDNARGLRSMVVGTGGKEHYAFGTIKPNSVARNNTSFGLLKVTLHPTSYDWQFVPVTGSSYTDAGSAACNTGGATNQPPVATMTQPSSGASFTQGVSVSFAGTGIDPEQGALNGSALAWSSSRDGQLGTGVGFSTSSLSVGTHSITLTATDMQGLTGTTTRTITITPTGGGNQAPTARFTVTCPTLQCTFDAGTSTDDAGIVSYAWSWGNGKSESHSTPTSKNTYASTGTWSVTLTVTDGGGLTNSTTQAVPVPSPSGNQPPSATITAPADGTSAVEGSSVTFAGSGTDPETGALSGAALLWTSDRDGPIGSGTGFSTTALSVGSHIITLTATDPLLATGTATRTITITPAGGGNLPPTADFTFACNTGAPHQCQMNAGTSTDDHGIVSYAWTWGNGRGETKTVPVTKNTWPSAPGTFNVTLTVTDAGGLTASITKSVTVP